MSTSVEMRIGVVRLPGVPRGQEIKSRLRWCDAAPAAR